MGTARRGGLARESSSTQADGPLSPRLRKALVPWIDLDAVDWEAFEAWLFTVLATLPRPGTTEAGTGEDRLRALSLALVQAAQERAVSHFQAAEYFRDNQMLARRVKALEALLRAAQKRGFGGPGPSEETLESRAAARYLPRGKEADR
ncbi:MAG: hypothetical protein HKL79_01025 [Thermoplasmata archaeon]|nr:hypothetical protein [Thermoplasmata archaeon]